MKKIITLALALMMVLALAACGGDNGKTPSGSNYPSDSSGNTSTAKPSGDDAPTTLSQAQMEAEIVRRLSGVSDIASLTLCGGSKIEYTEDGVFFAGDYWEVTNPTMASADLDASLEAQLSAHGFIKKLSLLGTDWVVPAGTGSIGISIMYDEDEVTFRMTNFRDDYTEAFIAAENAKLPTIIEARTILDKLPDNFSVTYSEYGGKYIQTVCRFNGSWYIEHENTESEKKSVSYNAAVLQPDGSFKFYSWSIYGDSVSKPSETTNFQSSTSPFDEQIQNLFDYDGDNDLGSLSTWVQMCWDYKGLAAEDSFIGKANRYFSISSNVTKTGTETIAGLNCDVVKNEGLWAPTYKMAFDTKTGMLCRYELTEYEGTDNEKTTVYFEVLSYDANPTALGTFVQP